MFFTKRVLLIIETSKVYGRGLLDGIGRYALTHGGWSLYVEERGLKDRHPSWLRAWKGDGIIFRSTTRTMVEAIRRTGLPAVDTNSAVTNHGFPLVYADEDQIAQLAIGHFLERKFHHFAFCTIEENTWVKWRREAFLRHATRLGLKVHLFSASRTTIIKRNWDHQQRQLSKWIAALPKPIAILAANDVCGIRLSDVCRMTDVQVPEQVAILGVDNDEVLCRLSSPPLSSIDLNCSLIGYHAAALLDDMMSGRNPSREPVWIPPKEIVVRQSTEIMAIEDKDLARALSFIRLYACQGINVYDVLKNVQISRATLERKFATYLGRTPGEEIVRVRLEHVKRLLNNTDYPLARIAELTGFKNPSHLSVVFKRVTGQTPQQYRLASI